VRAEGGCWRWRAGCIGKPVAVNSAGVVPCAEPELDSSTAEVVERDHVAREHHGMVAGQ